MSDVVNGDDPNLLAAEYVLGTLEADERTRASGLLDVDHQFRSMVSVWECRLGELHLMVEPVEPDPKIWDRGNGRIYKLSYRGTKPVQPDLQKLSDLELARLQTHENDWYVRHARRLLQERGKIADEAGAELLKIALDDKDATRRLRGLWALHVTGLLDRNRHVKARFIFLQWADYSGFHLCNRRGLSKERAFARLRRGRRAR